MKRYFSKKYNVVVLFKNVILFLQTEHQLPEPQPQLPEEPPAVLPPGTPAPEFAPQTPAPPHVSPLSVPPMSVGVPDNGPLSVMTNGPMSVGPSGLMSPGPMSVGPQGPMSVEAPMSVAPQTPAPQTPYPLDTSIPQLGDQVNKKRYLILKLLFGLKA